MRTGKTAQQNTNITSIFTELLCMAKIMMKLLLVVTHTVYLKILALTKETEVE